MSKTRTFTKAGLKRAITAAQESGLRITGIRPDGTLLVADAGAPLAPAGQAAHTKTPSPEADGWGNVEA